MSKTIAVLGGTGAEGGGLAIRWANAGYKVILGSRSKEKADAAEEQTGGADRGSRREIGSERAGGSRGPGERGGEEDVEHTAPRASTGHRATIPGEPDKVNGAGEPC